MKEKYAKEKEERDAAKRALLREKSTEKEENITAEEKQEATEEQEVGVKVEEALVETEGIQQVEEKEKIEPMEVDDENKKEDGDIKMEEPQLKETEETKTAESVEIIGDIVEEKAPSSVSTEIIEEDEKLTPFEELIRVASLLNPRQFELPPSMTDHFPFQGTERVDAIRNGRRIKTKRLIELDSYGCVPMPAKFCFSCNKTCKKAPLVSCDYCSLYFHQDCLDPPMTALPMGRWMCPNHPQHFIVSSFFFFTIFLTHTCHPSQQDWNLVSSISATERMKVWDEYGSDPIDHEVVKLQFFRKVHMANPPFRAKLKRKARDEVEVPEIIRYQYDNPPKLLPSLRDVFRIDNLRKRGTVPIDVCSKTEIEQIDEQLKSFSEARERIKSIFEDQEDIHGLLVEQNMEEEMPAEDHEKVTTLKSPRSRKTKSNTDKVIDIDDIKMEVVDDKVAIEENEPKISSDVVDDVKQIKSAHESEGNISINDGKKEEVADSISLTSLLKPNEMKTINEQLENLSEETIKLLAFQRFQQIVNENPNYIQKFQDKSTASKCVTEIAKWDILRFPIPLSPEDKEENADSIFRLRETPFHLRNESDKAHSIALSLTRPIKRSKIKSRAVFTFANDYLSGRVWFSVAPSMDLSVRMRYRNFTIGYGHENDLDLSRFGNCSFVSNKHAVVFFDDVTKQFELMNYSDFGSEVNGQMFCCDFTEHTIEACESPSSSPLKDKRVAVQSKIKNMIDAKKKIRECGMDKQGNDTL